MNILVFAGTTEGRLLIETLLDMKKVSVCACVATEYGKEILEQEPGENLEINTGRLTVEGMQQLMARGFDMVIDATHPYATLVTDNIKEACHQTNIKYIRLLREKTQFGSDCVFVENTDAVIRYLNTTEGNVLLTTGSKELARYTEVKNYQERLYARVLPMEPVLASCNELGFSGRHLICMQGPFSCELNVAMLKQLNCTYMVTKDTGTEGGAYEKYQAAQNAGATLIVVGRGEQDCGMSLPQVIQEINRDLAMPELADWFPMFINIKDRNIAIIGAGKIASRRIRTLLQFSCNIRIVAKEIPEEIKQMIHEYVSIDEKAGLNRSIELLEKEFDIEDVNGAHMVLAATNSREVNENIGIQCKNRGILVNVADKKEECDFYFPGVVIQGNLVTGITAQGKSHSLAKKGSEVIKIALRDMD